MAATTVASALAGVSRRRGQAAVGRVTPIGEVIVMIPTITSAADLHRSPGRSAVPSYNQNLWMHHLTGGATYLPL
jgi:hypothetical protein